MQVISRMRGGGRHKYKKSKAEKKRDRSQEKPEQTRGREDEFRSGTQAIWTTKLNVLILLRDGHGLVQMKI